jgi:hypothetical protein
MHYSNWKEATVNTTLIMRNTSVALYLCTDTVENGYLWYDTKLQAFGTFNDLLLGFLQNLLGNAVRLNALTDKLKTLNDTEDQ